MVYSNSSNAVDILNKTKKIKLKIGHKVVLLLIAFSILPLGAVNLYWFRESSASLNTQAINQQKLITSNATFRVNQYITDKLNALIIHSQSPSVLGLTSNASFDLYNLMQQDGDIVNITLADSNGRVLVNMDRNKTLATNFNISNQPAFKAATFLAGRQYLGPVHFISKDLPEMQIAVPLVQFDKGHNLLNLSTADPNQIRTSSQIKGVLIETIDLNKLWQTVLSQGSVYGGIAFVVDGQGNLIAYPNQSFQASHQNLKQVQTVAAFLNNPSANPSPRTLISETGTQVLSSYGVINATGWGVITEEPTSTIFAAARHVNNIGTTIFVTVAVLATILSIVFAKTITRPIRRLVEGTKVISQGNLDYRLSSQSGDELGLLAESFNTMSTALQRNIQRITAESTKANIILNNVSEGVVAVDSQKKIILANKAAAAIVNCLPENLINQDVFTSFLITQNGSTISPEISEVGLIKEVTLTNPDKRIHYLDVLINPIQNDPTGMAAIITFIDRTNELELENMKIDFVSMAAHELRTPMTTIQGYIDLILNFEEIKLPDLIFDYMKRIQSSSKQLANLVNNILNASRIERNTLSVNMDKVDWTDTIRSVIRDMQFNAKVKNIKLTFPDPGSDIFVIGDSLSLTEVLNNLISNAINYTENGGSVKVNIRQSDNHIETEIIDTGVGIAANKIPFLFTKFYRAKEGLPSGSGGTGLGLFISKSIIDKHNGSIRVESQEGIGSKFTIVLPMFDQARYNEIVKENPNRISKNRGWAKKDTISRR